jgi:hypothetical protein
MEIQLLCSYTTGKFWRSIGISHPKRWLDASLDLFGRFDIGHGRNVAYHGGHCFRRKSSSIRVRLGWK